MKVECPYCYALVEKPCSDERRAFEKCDAARYFVEPKGSSAPSKNQS